MGSSGKDASPSSETQKQHRIYVGGMDPIRGLTAKDVLRRLESRLDQEKQDSSGSIQIKDLHMGDCYFQFTAVCNKDNEESPLATIKPWFHNVTWKGCKLRVEEARPHFLQRLQSEIQARRKSKEQELTSTTTSLETMKADGVPKKPVPSGTSGGSAPSLPRHWRVRRGFGFTANDVDTQPCKVTDWEMFSRIRERHKVQQLKLNAEATSSSTSKVDPKKLSYYNRSIQLTFSSEHGADAAFGTAKFGSNGDADSAHLSSSESSSSSDDSNLTAENRELKNGSKYVWSDDDDDDSTGDDSSTEVEEERLHTKTMDEVDSVSEESSANDDHRKSIERDLHEEESEASKENSEVEPEAEGQSTAPEPIVDREYVWSDDDSSSDGRESSEKRPNIKVLPQVKQKNNDLGEFAPGVVDFDNGSVSTLCEDNNMSDDDERPVASTSHDVDLQRDVETNLHVLSQLFPEFSKEEPLQTDADVAKNAETAAANTPTTTSGWGATGQMLRFDPTNPQLSNQFVLEENNKDSMAVKSGSSSSSSSSVDEDEEIPMQASPQSPKADTEVNANIYEQGKLEQVFKEMRESTDQVVPAASGAVGSGFSFGFDLGDAKTTNPKSAGSFSFSFSVPETNEGATVGEMDQPEDVDKNPSEADASSEQPNQFQRRRRRAFEFPSEEELDERVRHFYYDLNDGARMIEDLDGWRNDPAVKERWLKERFTLTQDWKRKRKYALSKKQKRLK